MRATRFTLGLFAALLATFLAGCQLFGPANEGRRSGGETLMSNTREGLLAAQEAWAAAAVDDYRFTYERMCFCMPDWRGPFEITVRDGQITGATREGQPVDLEEVRLPTIPDLLATIADALNQRADRLEVTYQMDYGVPVQVEIDYDFGLADEEITHFVRDFTVL